MKKIMMGCLAAVAALIALVELFTVIPPMLVQVISCSLIRSISMLYRKSNEVFNVPVSATEKS